MLCCPADDTVHFTWQDISVTAMKAVCRKAGISKWPYRRIQFYKSRGMQFSAEEVMQSGSRPRGSSKRK